jgi:hypothetical protein
MEEHPQDRDTMTWPARMKSLLILAFVCFTALHCDAQAIQIGTNTFYPAYTNSSSEGFLREYCLRAETPDNWTKLFAVRHFRNVESPKDYINRMGEEYRKKLPHMTFAAGGQESKNRWFIDYLTYEKGEPKLTEWSFFRAETNVAGGIFVYQYSERMKYKKSVKELDTWDIKGLRKQMLPILMTNEFSLNQDAS